MLNGHEMELRSHLVTMGILGAMFPFGNKAVLMMNASTNYQLSMTLTTV